MLVRYKGQKKAGMHVTLPVGATSKREVRETILLAPKAELPDEDAVLLVELDPHNFELVKAKKEKSESEEPEEEHDHEVEEASVKPLKRKKKIEE